MQSDHSDRSPSHSQRLPVNPRRHKVAPEHRKRVATACNSCNVRRIKCSGEQPCSQCAASSRDCVYPATTPKVSIPRSELEELRRRIEAYDKVLQDAVPDADKRRQLLRGRNVSPDSTSYLPQQQPLSPVKTEVTPTTEDDAQSFASVESQLLHDAAGTARFHGESSDATIVEELRVLLHRLVPLADSGSVPFTLGGYQSSDSRPLPLPDPNPVWLPPPSTVRTMLSVLSVFIQDGTGDQPSRCGGIYWWGNLGTVPALPTSSGRVEIDTRNAHRLAFYQTALAVACRIASTKPAATGLTPDRSEPFFSRATALLGNPLDVSRCSIGEVSVLTLMAYYMLECDRPEAAALHIGVAAQIAIGIGAHKSFVDERGKRIFWTLYVLDRWVSSLLGRPPAISDQALQLPRPLDAPSMPPSAGLWANVELARISTHITCNLHRVDPCHDATAGSKASQDKALTLLEQWSQELPPSLQLSLDGLSSDSATCSLHMHANHLIILAQRPELLMAVKANAGFSPSFKSSQSGSRETWEPCITAAKRNMRLARHVATLHRPRRLLHHSLRFVFGAVLCFILRSLLGDDDADSGREIDFSVQLFDREAQAGNTYGLWCANTLRELQVLIAKGRGGAMAMEVEQAFETHMMPAASWQDLEVAHEPGEEASLHEDVLSWMDNEWSFSS